ncbi:MAG: hypothetical protein JNL71_15030 [Rhodospirillales bacterium]|nr:hypothetical protein [Rhodospirillales bacterium]
MGVYFFFEPGELRTGSGSGPRLVRIGTHALKAGARSTLLRRLRQHAGNSSGTGGNHRGSIFRLLVGDALIKRDGIERYPSWGKNDGIDRSAESEMEAAVSDCLGRFLFLCLPIDDPPGPDSGRGYIERNVIALASGSHGPIVDPPSPLWLGHNSSRDKVRRSGLWNQRHVDESHDPDFLEVLDAKVAQAAKLKD